MEITIITTSNNNLQPVRQLGILLSKVLSTIHMVHWFVEDYNAHKILGDLYETLDPMFDSLLEEVLGTSKSQGVLFPAYSPDCYDLNDTEQFDPQITEILDTYYKCTVKFIAIIKSVEFNNYLEQVDSGINNTREDIISAINKANYLLGLLPQSS